MTGETPQNTGRCDECRRDGMRIARVHRGERFCQACYKRLFKRRLCPKCGNFARLPRLDSDAICLTCENARPCVRCGKTEFRIGMRTPYGPACIGCTPYFKAPEPCEACGTESRWLSRRKELGHDLRLCPRCARKGSHGTCAACRRHRLVEPTPGGRRLCRACREQGEIPCPECRRPMPAGCGRRCWTCYWKQLARRRIRIGSAGLASPVLAKRFGEFGAWLVEKTGGRRAALNVNRHLEFFQQIEHQCGDIPGYTRLLQHFGAAGLRRHLTARRWMEDVGLITVDRTAREAAADRRRIEATLDRLPAGSKACDMLEEYGNRLSLRVRRGEITLRSMRLALTPAAKLLEVAAARRRLPPDQGTLDAFLRDAPGQASALNGFVSHLRRVHGAELTMPKRWALQRQRERRAKLLPELLAMMREPSKTGIVNERWVQLALQYFHDLPARAGETLAEGDLTTDAEGVTIRIDEQCYWIPWPERAAAASTVSLDMAATSWRGRSAVSEEGS